MAWDKRILEKSGTSTNMPLVSQRFNDVLVHNRAQTNKIQDVAQSNAWVISAQLRRVGLVRCSLPPRQLFPARPREMEKQRRRRRRKRGVGAAAVGVRTLSNLGQFGEEIVLRTRLPPPARLQDHPDSCIIAACPPPPPSSSRRRAGYLCIKKGK